MNECSKTAHCTFFFFFWFLFNICRFSFRFSPSLCLEFFTTLLSLFHNGRFVPSKRGLISICARVFFFCTIRSPPLHKVGLAKGTTPIRGNVCALRLLLFVRPFFCKQNSNKSIKSYENGICRKICSPVFDTHTHTHRFDHNHSTTHTTPAMSTPARKLRRSEASLNTTTEEVTPVESLTAPVPDDATTAAPQTNPPPPLIGTNVDLTTGNGRKRAREEEKEEETSPTDGSSATTAVPTTPPVPTSTPPRSQHSPEDALPALLAAYVVTRNRKLLLLHDEGSVAMARNDFEGVQRVAALADSAIAAAKETCSPSAAAVEQH
jgi:hypothetical protein